MKSFIQKPALTLAALLLVGHLGVAKADTASDTETILNWAENTFSDLFPSHQGTQSIDPWLFRFYPETGIYAGVNLNDNGVYVLGGPWDTATLIDTLPNVVNLALGGDTGISGCNTTAGPAGISYSQSGNVVTVTTNGQCIPAPNLTDPSVANLCQVPEQPSATGISVLSTNTVTSSSLEGITSSLPINPFDSILNASANVQYCTINAPTSTADLTVNTDLCFDITELTASFPTFDGITITPPVNYRLVSTATSAVVSDCFATDASAIFDAFTGETWTKDPLSGTFVSTGN